MPDQLRGPTPRPIRHDPSGPHSIAEDTTRRLSPAETSQVTELVTALADSLDEKMAKKLDLIVAVLDNLRPPQSGESVVMSRAKRTGYRGTIGGLALALVAAVTYAVTEVRAYGDGREAAAKTAIAAEAKAEAAERSAQATAELAQATAERVDRLEQKIDRLLELAGDR